MAFFGLDWRDKSGGKYPIIRDKVTVTVADGTTSGETDVEINGTLRRAHFVVPALGGDTAELKIEDEDNNDAFTSDELAQSLTHNLRMDEDVAGTVTFRVETSGAVSGDKSFDIYYNGL